MSNNKMIPRSSPSWPTLGQVQKLTELFEEKSQTPAEPPVIQKPEPMPKLKPELLLRIQFALGELQAEASPIPKLMSKTASEPSTLHETQPDDDNAPAIGDEDIQRCRSWNLDSYQRFLR